MKSVDWWMFALTGLVAIFIAIITISCESIKAALANRVKSFKN